MVGEGSAEVSEDLRGGASQYDEEDCSHRELWLKLREEFVKERAVSCLPSWQYSEVTLTSDREYVLILGSRRKRYWVTRTNETSITAIYPTGFYQWTPF